LRGQAERALASRTLKTTRDKIEGIISESDGIIKTFDALLMISKVEAGASTIDLKPVDLNRLIADLHELFEASFEEKDVALILDHQHLPPVNANRELIVQALINLLDNALKYGHAKQGAKTVIKSYKTDDHVVIDIADNGQGISKEDQERVQERFVRLDNSRTLPGSGLGLSMVKAIASLHGGTLTLHDNSPGLICRFSLPL
jgi:signal transduction histidine kinase